MATSKRTHPQKPARGQVREALLDATLSLVRKQGWAATSVDQLCAATGVTKGAFFHHFPSKDALGIAAAQRWTQLTGPVFEKASYHRKAHPLDRVLGYLDLRLKLTARPIEDFSCFAGTTVQEVYRSAPTVRDALCESIEGHAATLIADFQAVLDMVKPALPVTAESLALYTQTVLQGGFVLAKAKGHRGPAVEALEHLKQYLQLLFR